MDQVAFSKWFSNFNKPFNGIEPPDEWCNEVEKTQDGIRNLIGGVRKIEAIELQNSFNPCDYSIIEKYVSTLIKLIPAYFTYYKIPTTNMCFPFVTGTKIVKRVNWKTHIKYWINKNKDSISPAAHLQVNKVISDLGQTWEKLKTQKQVMYVNMTTDPRAFAHIGHYGPDQGSCFRQCMSNQIHKYWLGLHPNTFVLLVQKSPKEEFEAANNKEILSRMWGFSEDNFKTFHLANYYPEKGVNEANIYGSIEKFFGGLLNINRAKRFKDKYTITPINNIGVYHNKNFNMTLCDPSITPKTKDYFIGESGCFVGLTKCSTCSKYQKKSCMLTVEACQHIFCKACYDKLPICGYDGKKYYGNGSCYTAVFNGKKITINSNHINQGIFIESRYSHLYYHVSEIKHVYGGYQIGKPELKSYNMVECTCGIVHSISIKCPKCGNKAVL